MFNKNMKKIISQAIELDIINIETKDGYNGADLLKISSYNKQHLEILRSMANFNTVEVKILTEEATIYTDNEIDIYNLFCVFSEDKHSIEIYELKET
jgi:hypothetical protein